jgi:hypothetical protein
MEEEMGGTCRVYGVEEKCIRILVGKPEGKRPHVRPSNIWDDSVKRDMEIEM